MTASEWSTFLESLVPAKRPKQKAGAKPVLDDVVRFEKEWGFQFPDSYKEFVSLLGAGDLARTFEIQVPYAHGKYDMVNYNSLYRQELERPLAQREGKHHMAQLQRMITFSNNYKSEAFAWDPNDLTDAARHEFGIYYLQRHVYAPKRVAESFPEFVASFCLGDGAKSAGDSKWQSVRYSLAPWYWRHPPVVPPKRHHQRQRAAELQRLPRGRTRLPRAPIRERRSRTKRQPT